MKDIRIEESKMYEPGKVGLYFQYNESQGTIIQLTPQELKQVREVINEYLGVEEN